MCNKDDVVCYLYHVLCYIVIVTDTNITHTSIYYNQTNLLCDISPLQNQRFWAFDDKYNVNSFFHILNKDMKDLDLRLVVYVCVLLFGLVMMMTSCKSSCNAGYCDAYGSNDVVVEIDRV